MRVGPLSTDRPIVISRDGVLRTGMTYTRSRTRHVAAQVIPLVILRLVVSACYFLFLQPDARIGNFRNALEDNSSALGSERKPQRNTFDLRKSS